MTYLLQKNGYLESLKHRASVSNSLKEKLDAARLGYGDEIGEEEIIDEEDETEMMMLFKSQVNKLLTKPLSVAKFYTEFPDKYVPYFSSVFPKLKNMYLGTSPEPLVLKNVAVGMIEKLIQQSSAQSSSVNVPASEKKEQKNQQDKYICPDCGKEVSNTRQGIRQHNKSKVHTRALQKSQSQSKLSPHPLQSQFYEIFDDEDTRLIN